MCFYERHGRAQRVIAPGDPAIHSSSGLVEEDVDALNARDKKFARRA